MGKKDTSSLEQLRIEQLKYIKEKMYLLPLKDKITVINILAMDLDIKEFCDSAAGCHICINDLSKDSIDSIIKIISYHT